MMNHNLNGGAIATTTVKELKTYLETLPEETEVEVLVEKSGHYQTYTQFEPLEIGPYSDTLEFVDLTGNPYVKPEATYFGKKFLKFGSS